MGKAHIAFGKHSTPGDDRCLAAPPQLCNGISCYAMLRLNSTGTSLHPQLKILDLGVGTGTRPADSVVC